MHIDFFKVYTEKNTTKTLEKNMPAKRSICKEICTYFTDRGRQTSNNMETNFDIVVFARKIITCNTLPKN